MTAKQQLFITEYLIDLNATKAAIRAGYSQKTARFIGQENLTKPYIKKEIEKELQELAQRAEIKANHVLKELALIAFADMKDYITINKDGSIQAKTFEEMPEGASRAIAEVREIKHIITTGKGSGEEIVLECRLRYKHHNKLRALELLGNHLGMWKDRQSHEVPNYEIFELPALRTPEMITEGIEPQDKEI